VELFRRISLSPKSGATPDLTGVTPVPPQIRRDAGFDRRDACSTRKHSSFVISPTEALS
jgi:hypothetical protein